MSDQPNAGAPQGSGNQPQIRVVVDDDRKHGEYANFVVVSHGPHEFTIDFCQLLPSGDPKQVNADVVSRIRVAPTMVGQMLRALNANLTNYESKFGDVKALG